MSRRRARSTPSRAEAGPAPAPIPGDQAPASGAAAAAAAPDLSFRLAVDELLSEMAAEGRGGVVRTSPSAPARTATEGAASRQATATGSISTSVAVAGMTCRACEVRIQRHVGRIPGVRHVAASAVRGRVQVESDAPIPSAALERAIRAAGYEVGGNPWLARDPRVWATALGGVILVTVLAAGAQLAGLGDLASRAGDLASGGLLVALLLGLAAGVSTCMALVGGLVLALSASFRAAQDAGGVTGGAAAQLRPAIVFVAGRVAGYAALGAVLGAIGASVAMPPQLTAILMVGVAILMTILGTRLTGLSPRIATWSPTLPMGLGRQLGLDGRSTGAYSDSRAALLGAASFFLPCGFTQAVQVYALSTGSPLYAGAILAVFAIGTAPGLLALGGLPAIVPSTARPTLFRLVGVVVLAFAFVNASAAARLAGVPLPGLGVGAAEAAQPAPGPVATDGAQSLTTFQDGSGYRPANATIYAGIPTRWTIESTDDATCAIFLVVPAVGLQVKLDRGPNVIDLPAMDPGTLTYSCSMGMYGGQITIVPPPTGAGGGGEPG